MQVVYSGGSTTPSPSPRIHRKMGYTRPVMPGYNTHVQPQVLVQRSRDKPLTEGDTTLRDSIPLMSKSVATLCLVLNIFIPGSGTLLAGLSVMCGSKIRPRGGSKRHCVWLNSWVALIQFLLTFLFLLGWIWSITWGVAFLTISRQHSKRQTGGDKARNREGDRPHAKVFDTSKHPNSQHSTTQQTSKPSKHAQQHAYRSGNHHNKEHLNFHQNNNKSHAHNKHDRHSKSSSPHNSPTIPRQESLPDERSTQISHVNCKTLDPSLHEDRNTTVPNEPIIVLQKAPETTYHSQISSDYRKSSPNETIMQARTRHMKMLQRKLSDNDLSPFVLTNKQLEAIVIHDLPLVLPPNRTRGVSAITEESEGLPKMERT